MPPAPDRRDVAIWIELALLGVFVTWIAWPFLDPTQFLTAYDTVTYAGPNLVVTNEQLVNGHLPAWNDDLFGGVPHLANAQVAALYIPRWPLALLEPARALDLTIALHLYWLAAGVFVLTWRRLRLAPPARLIASVAVVGSGAVMARSLQFEQITVVAWIPWLLIATDWVIADPRWRPRAIAALGLVTALTLVSGHPQQTYLAVLLVMAWCIGRAIDASHPIGSQRAPISEWVRSLGKRAVRVGAGLALGAALASVQLAATANLYSQADLGANQSLAQASDFGYVLKPSLLAPTYLGNPFASRFDFTAMGAEAMAFVGVGVVLLALVGLANGLASGRRRATVVVLGLVAVGSTLLALGPRCTNPEELTCSPSGLAFRAAAKVLPGFAQTRAAGRLALLAVVALAILAAFGTDALVRRAITRRQLTVAGGMLGAVIVVGLIAGPASDGDVGTDTIVWWSVAALVTMAAIGLGTFSTARRAPIIAGAAVAGLILVELAIPGANSLARDNMSAEPFTAHASAISSELERTGGIAISIAGTKFDDPAYLGSALRPNANASYGTRSIDGYDGGLWVTRRWAAGTEGLASGELDASLPISWQLETPIDADLLARLGVGYAVLDLAQTRQAYGLEGTAQEVEAESIDTIAPGWIGPVARDGELVLLENPVRVTDGAVWFAMSPIESLDDAGAAIADADDNVAVVERADSLSCSGDCTPRGVQVDRPRPGVAQVAIDLDRPAVLSIGSQPLPGWTVTVDGSPAEVVAVDAMRLGVELEPGDHAVEFVYHPPGLWLSILLTALAAVVVFVALAEPKWLRPPPAS